MKRNKAIHPGIILQRDFLLTKNIDLSNLAHGINVPVKHLEEICQGQSDLTTDLAYRLAAYFQNSVKFWLDLQIEYELNYWAKELALVTRTIKPYQEIAISN